MRTNPIRRGAVRAAALAAALAVSACDGDVAAPGSGGGLILTVTAAQVSADQGRLNIEGPTNRTLTLSPGDSREIDLPAGTYSVALEGLSGGTVVGYWERGSVNVSEGRQTSLTVSLAAFQASTPSAAATAVAGQPVTVTWSAVSGAASYDVEVSASSSFGSLLDQRNVTGTSTQFTLSQSGTVYFRVRPRTRFGGVGNYGQPSSGTLVRVPVASIDVSPPTAQIEIGENTTFTAVTRGPSNEILSGRSVTWSSSNTAVATVNPSTGQVSGVAEGDAEIRATSEGVTGSAMVTVVNPGQAPAVNAYEVIFLPVIQGCGAGFRDFRTDEAVAYVDNDGTMDPSGTFEEPVGGSPVGIQSEWREEGETNWKPFGYTKGWTPDGGATGTSGILAANGSTCWGFDGEPTFVDFRVRVQDTDGNWSPWFEKRLDMPTEVTVTPGRVNIPAGQTQQYAAEARDANGLVVPGNPINWSTYIGSPHATITPDGLYTVDPATVGGADWVAARAGYASGVTPVLGGTVADGSWFSPTFFQTNINLALGATLTYRVRVYAGREYVVLTSDTQGATATGDVDVYIRFGQAPTTTTFDDRGFTTGRNEQVTWTAPSDGVLWVMLQAYDDPNSTTDPPVAGVRLDIDGDEVPPPEVQVLPTPGAATGSTQLLTDEEASRSGGMLLAPVRGSGPGSPVSVAPGGGG